MFDPKVFYSFYTIEDIDKCGEDSTQCLIDKLKKDAWELTKEFIPQEFLYSIEEKIEISNELITYTCDYKPLIKKR